MRFDVDRYARDGVQHAVANNTFDTVADVFRTTSAATAVEPESEGEEEDATVASAAGGALAVAKGGAVKRLTSSDEPSRTKSAPAHVC